MQSHDWFTSHVFCKIKSIVAKACLAEEEKLRAENAALQHDVELLKRQLVDAEVKNGGKWTRFCYRWQQCMLLLILNYDSVMFIIILRDVMTPFWSNILTWILFIFESICSWSLTEMITWMYSFLPVNKFLKVTLNRFIVEMSLST